MQRRELLQLPVLTAAGQVRTEVARRLFIDPRQARLPSRPWRKIHLDFHNSSHVPRIGERFNADEFGDRLAAAHVDSIVVFAKDMHGYFYYPSEFGPVHPGLSFDLLGAQVEACRKRKIAVYAYYCTTWDHYLAENHPEWLVVKRDRTTYLPRFDQTPGWTALCIANSGFVRLVSDHTREFVSRYPLDGAWFDMPIPIAGECFCHVCLKQMRAAGADPFSVPAQRAHKQELEIAFLKTLREAVVGQRPGCQVDFNNQGAYGLAERVAAMDNIDIEALPSADQWGYFYFPLIVRYARTQGVTTYGMTGRFKASWADFGGLKLPAQLAVEVAGIVANGARCDIGDQAPPNGRLDPAVYHVIGKAYGHIRKLEPYLEGAAPVTEAAMLVSGPPLTRPNTDPHIGWTKLLTETRVQFDVVEPQVPWERYALIVLPEELSVTAALAERLHAYVAGGGALIVSHNAGLLDGGGSWLDRYGMSFDGNSEFRPAYMVPRENFTGDIPEYEYALYEGASRWRAQPPAAVVAQLGEPLFQRTPKHFTSHAQTPFERETPFAAVARSGRVGLFAFPVGTGYFNQGYWVYRSVFRHVLRSVLPVPAVESDAPVNAEVELTHQAAAPGRNERYLVHVVNWSANRGTPRHPVFHEEPVALTGVRVSLNVPFKVASATAVVSGARLSVRTNGRGAEVRVPSVPIHEVVCFEGE